jgi:5'-methylthioadenosine phosphorylase
MFRQLGCDIVGMTSAPEVFLAKEAGLCYASICFVSNMAAGMQARVSHMEVEQVASRIASVIRTIVSQSIVKMKNMESCTCRRKCEG